MTKKKIEDYFNLSKYPNANKDEYQNYKWNKPEPTYGSSYVLGREDTRGMSEKIAAPQGVAFPTWVDPNAAKAPDMYSQAVALDGREPASVPIEYTAPMNADQRVLAQLQALNGGTMPAIDPTVRVPDQVVNGTYPSVFTPPPSYDYQEATVPSFNPGFVDATTPIIAGHPVGNPTSPAFIPVPSNILKDSIGNPVLNNGKTIGLPNQSTGNAATGGKGGPGGK